MKRLFPDYDEHQSFARRHRYDTGHRVQTGIHRQRSDRPSGVTHRQAIANAINSLGIAGIRDGE